LGQLGTQADRLAEISRPLAFSPLSNCSMPRVSSTTGLFGAKATACWAI
jgi:hypothetical protein